MYETTDAIKRDYSCSGSFHVKSLVMMQKVIKSSDRSDEHDSRKNPGSWLLPWRIQPPFLTIPIEIVPPRPWQTRIPNRSPPSPHTPPANAPVASYHISENHPQAFCVSRRIQGKQGTVRIDNKSLKTFPSSVSQIDPLSRNLLSKQIQRTRHGQSF